MMRFDYGQKCWVQDESLARWMVREVRQVRDEKLKSSDWTDTMSAIDRLGVERFNAWQQYRQALHDVTLQGDPYAIVWPVQPGGAMLSTQRARDVIPNHDGKHHHFESEIDKPNGALRLAR